MFARSVTISQADLGALDKGTAYVREDVMPQLGLLGCLGISMVASRMARQVIVTSSWETREAMDGTREAMAPSRAKVAELLDGEVSIAEWEVALMHRDHDAFDQAACRITWARTPDIDGLLERFRTMTMPSISEAMGFCSVSMFVDRERGAVCGTTTFDSRATLEASRARADANRLRMAQFVDVDYTDVKEFDLALAHLRLPELV